MTSIAVARNWRLASPEQQAAFVAEFRTLLVRIYIGIAVELPRPGDRVGLKGLRQNVAGAKNADAAKLAPVLMIYSTGTRAPKEQGAPAATGHTPS